MNLHYAFWISSYEELYTRAKVSIRHTEKTNEALTGRWKKDDKSPLPFQKQSLLMEVRYPGLLVGLGNTHTIDDAHVEKDGEGKQEAPFVKLGFLLDPVTGLPYIPGSTVKGVLRSAFFRSPAYVQAICETLNLNSLDVEKLDNAIFGTMRKKGDQFEEGQGDDIFLDAFPVETCPDGSILGMESITPHRSKAGVDYDRLSNPIPLRLLKIKPGVKIQFRFILKDSVIQQGKESGAGDITVTAGQKMALFQKLLEELGAGAKTNVGFGALRTVSNGPGSYTFLRPDINGRNQIPQNSAAVSPQRQQQNGNVRHGNQEGDKGLKCPHCGIFNYRYKKDTNVETWPWKNGICYKCGEKLRG